MEQRICKGCGVTKHYSEFYQSRGKPSGQCKECINRKAAEKKREKMVKLGKDRGCVYFVHAAIVNRIKVGFTRNNVYTRLKELQTLSPVELTVLGIHRGSILMERGFHKKFQANRWNGEWFNATPEMEQYIKTHCSVPGESEKAA